MSALGDLLDALSRDIPALPGAQCRGRSALFDPPDRRYEGPRAIKERQAAARRLCDGCPALDACKAWFTSLPRRQRPPGVVAGRIVHPKPVGRPRKADVA